MVLIMRNKTSWRKGQTGNPRGRPRSEEDLGALLRRTIDRKRFAEKLCDLCYAGDVQAMRLLLAYTDGLPIATAELETSDGLHIEVTYVEQNHIAVTNAAPGTISDYPASSTF